LIVDNIIIWYYSFSAYFSQYTTYLGVTMSSLLVL